MFVIYLLNLWGCVTRSLVLCECFVDRCLITPLVSSNSSCILIFHFTHGPMLIFNPLKEDCWSSLISLKEHKLQQIIGKLPERNFAKVKMNVNKQRIQR